MKRLACINRQNNRVIKDRQDDHHDNVVKYLIGFVRPRYCVENEEKL